MARGIFSYLISRGKTVLLMNDAEETLTAAQDDGQLRLYNDGTNQFMQTFSRVIGAWEKFDPRAVLDTVYAAISHAASHADGGADEITVEGLATASADVSTALRPDGAGGLAFSDVGHGDLTGVTADQHHTEAHALDAVVHTGSLPFTDLSGTISDAQHGTVAQANAHAHSNLSGVTADQHHPEAHTVASHSDTTGTGAELNTLTDGSNADSLHVHAKGWTLAGSQTTEGSTQSTTEADVLSVTGLSIAAASPIKVVCSVRFVADGGGARTGNVGLEINATSVVTANDILFSQSAGGTESGRIEIYIPPRQANYLKGSFHATGDIALDLLWDNDGPNATITSITVRGLVSNALAELFADDMYVYTLATS